MATGKVNEIHYAKERDIEKTCFENELCHKLHEIHQQNVENLRINKIKFPFKSDFLHGD
jgi:hypothetical protein